MSKRKLGRRTNKYSFYNLKELALKYPRQAWLWFKGLTRKQKAAFFGGIAFLVFVVIPLIIYIYFANVIADPDRLINNKDTGVVLLDQNGEEFFSFYNARNSEAVPPEAITQTTRDALVAAEDKEFYNHGGYSIKSTLGALYANITGGDLNKYGGSTITQQLVKNALLTNKKSYIRKYQELVLSIAVDRRYEKAEILNMYLNSVYFGEGAFGIESAAQTYFDKPAKELDLAQTSMLIGLLPAPSAFSPISGDAEQAKINQKRVLDRMVDTGYITDAERKDAFAQELSYAESQAAPNDIAQHFALMVIEELKQEYGEEEITRSGFTVTTTLDLNWQREAERIVQEQIDNIRQYNATNGAMIAIDPNNGQIKALVGSVDWDNEEFGKVNMVTAQRQPGSSFKPLYYTEALDEEIVTPATILRDEPTDFGGGYRPENYDFAYRGDITLRNALANSLNIPAAKVMEKLGVQNAIDAAERLGITTLSEEQDYGLSLALGTGEVKLLEMANAYAAFAHQGQQFETTGIKSVTDKFGKKIYETKPKSKVVMGEDASFLISDILSDNVARAPSFANRLTIDRKAAVKTGTTEHNRDAWTIGYTPELVVGAWVGNNDNTEMTTIGGSSAAGPIWAQSMETFLAGVQSADFEKPINVSQIVLCYGSGLRAPEYIEGQTYTEYFIDGTEPEGTCNVTKPKPEEKKPEEDKKPKKKQPDQTEEDPTTPPDNTDTTGDGTGDGTTGGDGTTDTTGDGTTTGDGSGGTGTGTGSGSTTP